MTQVLATGINEKINEIAAVSANIPGVIIIHELPNLNLLFMSDMGLKLLGKQWEEIKKMSQEEFQQNFFNKEDAQEYTPKIVGLLERNTNESISYFQQVKTSQKNEWDWYMSTTKVLLRDHENNPALLITIAMPIDPHNYFTAKARRLLEENEFLKNHYYEFSQLTKREKEILALMAQGKTAPQIADTLYISEDTVVTHRKNIKKKIKISSPNDLYMYTHAFDLI